MWQSSQWFFVGVFENIYQVQGVALCKHVSKACSTRLVCLTSFCGSPSLWPLPEQSSESATLQEEPAPKDSPVVHTETKTTTYESAEVLVTYMAVHHYTQR